MEVDGSIDDVRLAVIMLMTDEPECRDKVFHCTISPLLYV